MSEPLSKANSSVNSGKDGSSRNATESNQFESQDVAAGKIHLHSSPRRSRSAVSSPKHNQASQIGRGGKPAAFTMWPDQKGNTGDTDKWTSAQADPKFAMWPQQSSGRSASVKRQPPELSPEPKNPTDDKNSRFSVWPSRYSKEAVDSSTHFSLSLKVIHRAADKPRSLSALSLRRSTETVTNELLEYQPNKPQRQTSEDPKFRMWPLRRNGSKDANNQSGTAPVKKSSSDTDFSFTIWPPPNNTGKPTTSRQTSAGSSASRGRKPSINKDDSAMFSIWPKHENGSRSTISSNGHEGSGIQPDNRQSRSSLSIRGSQSVQNSPIFARRQISTRSCDRVKSPCRADSKFSMWPRKRGRSSEDSGKPHHSTVSLGQEEYSTARMIFDAGKRRSRSATSLPLSIEKTDSGNCSPAVTRTISNDHTADFKFAMWPKRLSTEEVTNKQSQQKGDAIENASEAIADVYHRQSISNWFMQRQPTVASATASARLTDPSFFSTLWTSLRLRPAAGIEKTEQRHPDAFAKRHISEAETDTLPAIAEGKERSSLAYIPELPIDFLPAKDVNKDETGCQRFLDCCCGNLLHPKSDSTREMEGLKTEACVDYHKISVRELCVRLQTDMTYGLTEAAVRVRVSSYGFNKIRPPPPWPEWFKFCRNLFDGFCILLWIGCILCFIAYGMQWSKEDVAPNDNLYLGCVLAGVVLITGSFSYYQEAKSTKIMESFKKFMPSFAIVIRAGREQQVSVDDLVPGDIVILKAGDKIPADSRIIKSSNFKVDNSNVTGESEPQLRTPDCSNDNPLESKNVIFFSTFAVEGTATAVVVATGDHTVMGRIARLATGLKEKRTPIAKELDVFVYILCVMAAVLGIIFLICFLVLNPDAWIDALVLFIGVLVGVVPSGVLIEVALCLTLAAKRMAKENALLKNLEAVETLGSTSTICSDKTGTLTMNKMTVSHMWFNGQFHVADLTERQFGAQLYKVGGERSGWTSLIRISALCSRAVFVPGQEDIDVMQRECIGDGTETGLLKFAEQSIGSVAGFRESWPKLAEISFTSATKFQLSVHQRQEDRRHFVVMKGAPEKVIEMCSTIYLHGEDVPITEAVKENYNDVYHELAELGERVLGFAELPLPIETYPSDFRFTIDREPNFPITGLRFIGLISMMDPPRPSVPDAVRKCREAGIRVVMVTGDHPLTAKSIARMVGIIGSHSKTVEDIAKEQAIPVSRVDPMDADAIVISGNELRAMSEQDLDEVIAHFKEIVFARTSPQQKLSIVEGFQRAGDIVAVTGDGVNDSPALKQANIGIAMGISGSDVSKQAADMVLLDDNFATIVFAIEDGRKMFDNLKKTVFYILGGNETEIAAPLAAVALSIPLPMSTIAMLVLSLLTDMVPAIMLAFEDAEADIMKRKPRQTKIDSLVNRRLISVSMGMYGVVEFGAAFFAYFVVFAENGFLARDVWGTRKIFDAKGCNNLVDSYGQEWTYAQRKELQYALYSVYLLAVVEMQWVNVLVSKACRSHLFQQSWRNHYLYLGLVSETCIVVLLCYCPGVNEAFGLSPLLGRWWLIALPWGLLLVGIDQFRKYLIRRGGGPSSFGWRELLY